MLRDKCLSSLPQWIIYQPWHVLMSLALRQHPLLPLCCPLCSSALSPRVPHISKFQSIATINHWNLAGSREVGGEENYYPNTSFKKPKDNGLFVLREKGGWGLVETSDSSCFQDVDGVYWQPTGCWLLSWGAASVLWAGPSHTEGLSLQLFKAGPPSKVVAELILAH